MMFKDRILIVSLVPMLLFSLDGIGSRLVREDLFVTWWEIAIVSGTIEHLTKGISIIRSRSVDDPGQLRDSLFILRRIGKIAASFSRLHNRYDATASPHAIGHSVFFSAIRSQSPSMNRFRACTGSIKFLRHLSAFPASSLSAKPSPFNLAVYPTSIRRTMASAMAKRLEGKTIVVTGASSGIGKSTAQEFARTSPKNLKLILTARRIDTLKEVAAEIKKEVGDGVKVLPVKLDVSNPEEIKDFVPSLPEEFKEIDVLVNNA